MCGILIYGTLCPAFAFWSKEFAADNILKDVFKK